MLSPPKYEGTVETLPTDVVVLDYFKTTKISDWGLAHFLKTTGLTQPLFLSNVRDIARIKRLPLAIQIFAVKLKDYYGGVFQDEVAAIEQNSAYKEVNRQVLSGDELLLLQSQVKVMIRSDKEEWIEQSSEDGTPNSSSLALSSSLTGKRISAGTPRSSNKRTCGGFMSRGDCVDVQEYVDSGGTFNEDDDASSDTVVDGLKVVERTTPFTNFEGPAHGSNTSSPSAVTLPAQAKSASGAKMNRTVIEVSDDHEDDDRSMPTMPGAQMQYVSDNDDLFTGHQTPPKRLQGHSEDVPFVNDLEASFHNSDDTRSFALSGEDQALYKEASQWFKSKLERDTESTIRKVRDERFREPWVNDLLYDRLKLLRTGLNCYCDENTYTSIWIVPDFVALLTGISGLISKGFTNENHFTPSAWRRALCRGKKSAKGTNVDAYYVARDNHVDIIFENVGPPTCTDHTKYREDMEKSFRNAADALLDRFYNSTGSFQIAQEYKVLIVIVFGHEVTVYAVSIAGANEFKVSKIFGGKYHFAKDVYLANLLVHLKFCLTIKTVMERNIDVSIQFGNSIESLAKDEEAHYNLRLHSTPTKGQPRREFSMAR